MRLSCLAILFAACGDDAAVVRGPVEVEAYTVLTSPSGLPDHGALVVFADRDGTSRTAYIDETGNATGEVEAGGSVWVTRDTSQMIGMNYLLAYDDAQPGETLVFGPDPFEEIVATMTSSGTPGGDVNSVRLLSSCETSATVELRLPARCGAMVDVLALGYMASGSGDRLLQYALLPGEPVADGRVITIPPAAWRDVETLTLQLAAPAGAIATVARLSNYGYAVPEKNHQLTGSTLTVRAPLLGLRAHIVLARSEMREAGQAITVKMSSTATQTVNLTDHMAPWVVVDRGAGTWALDDLGGTLRPDAFVTEYVWNQPIANYEVTNQAIIISSSVMAGVLPHPTLPDALAENQPATDFRVDVTPRAVRFEATGEYSLRRAVAHLAHPGAFYARRDEDITSFSISVSP